MMRRLTIIMIADDIAMAGLLVYLLRDPLAVLIPCGVVYVPTFLFVRTLKAAPADPVTDARARP